MDCIVVPSLRTRARAAFAGAGVLVLAALTAAGAAADTLADVRQRGFLRCGLIEASPGFSSIDDRGERIGLDVDHCKTVAAAIFGAIKVEYVPITPHTAFTLLQSGGIDIFPGGATWTFTRDTTLGLDYTGVYLYTGQGFVVRADAGVRRVADLDGATICVAQGTTLEQNLADYFDQHGLHYTPVTFADIDMGLQAYRAGRCDAFTNETVSTAGRIHNWPDRDQHLILAEVISKEPMGALVRQGDPRWRDIALWSFNARVAAEELGINQANVDEVRATTQNAEARRLLGVQGNLGAALGLDRDWAYQVIKLVGSSADLWNRNFAPLGLERGINETWNHGGLLTALPYR
ncbi:MAG: amino acid ABC transporter substrate-binding protein [Gammaproteobacteria bacterium]|nr:amino acid ABC transporter substrate-binding protein [Gammaproteobacteria bacterium]